MKKIIPFLFASILFSSCKTDSEKQVKLVVVSKKDSINLSVLKTDTIDETQPFMNAYIVAVDTSKNYYELKKAMFKLNKLLKIKIDTLDRSYDKKNDFIGLVKNSNGKIYYDNYFPRRHNPTEFLSIEYLNYYINSDNENDKTIALISYITPEKKEAERQIKIIKQFYPKAFILSTKLFMGCMQ